MLFRAVNELEPQGGEQNAQRAHGPENILPAELMREPPHEGRKEHKREVLRRIENGGGGTTFPGGEPGSHETCVARKGRRERESGQEQEREKHSKREATF